MSNPATVVETIRTLLETQRLGVLSTHCEGQPYASLVAFGYSEDLSLLFFATPRSTRKYDNIAADDRVAMLIDSRANAEADFHEARAVTVTGRAHEASDSNGDAIILKKLYLTRHPHLKNFLNAPTCAFMVMRVQRWTLVEQFQNVTEYEVVP